MFHKLPQVMAYMLRSDIYIGLFDMFTYMNYY